MPTDCFVLRTPTILPAIRISWCLRPTFILISGRVSRSFYHLCASTRGFRPFDPDIILNTISIIWYLRSNILVNSHPAFFIVFKFVLLSDYAVELKTSYRDGQRKAGCSWAGALAGAFRRHFAQLVKERKQECLYTSVSTFLLQVVNGLR